MKRFKKHLNDEVFEKGLTEGKFPIWLRASVGMIVLRIRSLSQQIESEKDPSKQNKLIGRQNKLIAYINGLGIAVGSTDEVLLQKMKTGLVK